MMKYFCSQKGFHSILTRSWKHSLKHIHWTISHWSHVTCASTRSLSSSFTTRTRRPLTSEVIIKMRLRVRRPAISHLNHPQETTQGTTWILHVMTRYTRNQSQLTRVQPTSNRRHLTSLSRITYTVRLTKCPKQKLDVICDNPH